MKKISGSKQYTSIIVDDWLYRVVEAGNEERELARIKFQQGRSRVAGINGVHSEDLLIILLDRIQRLQAEEFVCVEHEEVLKYLKDALAQLRLRREKNRITIS